jgi:hypothetical protein
MYNVGCLEFLMGDIVRAHHVIVFMVQDMAMPYIAWAECRVEGEIGPARSRESDAVARHKSRPHNGRVLVPGLVDVG